MIIYHLRLKKHIVRKTSENHQTHIRLGSDRTIEQRSLAEFFIPTSPSIPGPNPRVLPRYHTTTAPQPKAEIGHTTVMTVGSRTRAFWEFYRINWPWECMEVLKWRLVDTDLKWRVDKLTELLQVIWPAGNDVKFRKGLFTRVLMWKMNQMTHAGRTPFNTLSASF